MKKPKPPKTFEEVENHVKAEGFCVDPWWFWKTFGDSDWYDTTGKPILSWKSKIRNLDKLQRSWGQVHKCSVSGCKKQGVYESGNDRDGHPLYRCIDHKPKYHPSLPKELTNNILKTVPSAETNINNRRNEEIRKLKL
jgi:hypothetical protein